MNFDSLYLNIITKHQMITENRKDMYSWLSPSGQIINVNPSEKEDHSMVAGGLIQKLKLQVVGNDFRNTTLFRHKFQRITHYGLELYCHNPFYSPNSKQLHILKNVAIENNMDIIKYDNEEDERVLWMK